jgi:cytochrome c-type biogenesis protein CcmF
MIAELGHFSLILALGLAVSLAIIPAMGVAQHRMAWMNMGVSLAAGMFVFLLLSFGCLTYAFLIDDFSVTYVARNSNSALPVHYKVSAVWGAHEGSFLLWTLIMGGWTFAVGIFGNSLTRDMLARVLSVMGFVTIGFILFMLLTSNPFDRSLPIFPAEGADLNPLLQDFGLIVHPPMLYMGYVGFSVPFAFAIATLMSGKLDSAWARWSRPWTNTAWAFLTIGITLGSWWAYYELGWGGWWFWDAVENASFLPWLVGTALVHSLAATEKRGVFRSWTVLLAIFAFSLSLLGAFLVRSGVLTSVHAFAVDPERGLFILAFLVIVIGSSLTLYAVRAAGIRSESGFDHTSRETLLLVNNVIIVVSAAAVLLGTIYPIIYEAMTDGKKISVGPPYFNTIFVPLMVTLFIFMAFSPSSRWRTTPLDKLLGKEWIVLLVSMIASAVIVGLFSFTFDIITVLIVGIAFWIVINLVRNLWHQIANKVSKLPALFRLSPSWWGMWIAHLGMAATIIGIVVTVELSEEKDLRMAPGDQVDMSGYTFHFDGVERVQGPNYVADRGTIRITRDAKAIVTLHPEKRRYLSGGSIMTEADIDPSVFRDLYVALGEPIGNEAWAVRLHYKPFVRWIWSGGMLVALGGFVTLGDRRYRAMWRSAASRLTGREAAA